MHQRGICSVLCQASRPHYALRACTPTVFAYLQAALVRPAVSLLAQQPAPEDSPHVQCQLPLQLEALQTSPAVGATDADAPAVGLAGCLWLPRD